MRPMTNFYRLLSDDEVEMLHEKALKILEDPGMKIENRTMLDALKKKGAVVDLEGETAKIPAELIEEIIGMVQRDEVSRIEKKNKNNNLETVYPDMLTFSWHTPFRNRTPEVQASLGGGAPYIMIMRKK